MSFLECLKIKISLYIYMPNGNYYQPHKQKLKQQVKLDILKSLLRKTKRVKSIIEIGIVI